MRPAANATIARHPVLELMAARQGHFKLESGHHGELWLDLDPVFLRPARLRPFAAEIAGRLAHHGVEAVCGPLTGGAFLAQLVAAEMDVAFVHAERLAKPAGGALYAAEYRVPATLRGLLAGKRMAIIDDVINAGSATRATMADLEASGARIVALAALLVLGEPARRLAADRGIALENLAWLSNAIWPPADCPLCAAGQTLENPGELV